MDMIFNIGKSGRKGVTIPAHDIPSVLNIQEKLLRKKKPELPECSELQVIRHFTLLSRKNIGVDSTFYPLGSCTMKYNPKMNEVVAAMPEFSELHPLLPQLRHGGALTQGALAVIYETERLLSEILGFAQFTMQPLAGAHGELTGVMMIAAYHADKNDKKRKIMLIPDSAHGTNPASAAMAGFITKTIKSSNDGGIDINELKTNLNENLAGLMITCPNTLGLFDPKIKEACQLVHDAGGIVYGDGANLNALVGIIKPAELGIDVMHVNLHKTFSTPHGSGGPGSGPVGVVEKLVPYLPISRVVKRDDGTYALEYNYPKSIGYIAPFYGNFAVILRAYAYLLSIGKEGLRRISAFSILNANYIRQKLKAFYHLPYDKTCMHECVFSAEKFLERGIHAVDIAKALIDKGYHPPTICFPLIVKEAIMIEPTETEDKETLDKFINAMIDIWKTINENPDKIKECPLTTPVSRVDETSAARKPITSI
ncbi:MAG TPA: aminomethyl-transferring glycine dehydrogenase subunit GcvPB [Victivallales bacterium]|nr:aminomethyl-transferring glycine dehydrogenase subunit GcvPB [Victivallales bacterium]